MSAHATVNHVDHKLAFAEYAVLEFELVGGNYYGRIAVGGEIFGEQLMLTGLDGFKRLFEFQNADVSDLAPAKVPVSFQKGALQVLNGGNFRQFMTFTEFLHRTGFEKYFGKQILIENPHRSLGTEVRKAHRAIIDVRLEKAGNREVFVTRIHLGEHTFTGEQIEPVQ